MTKEWDPETDGLRSRTSDKYNDAQKLLLAYGAMRFLKRKWFDGIIEPPPDRTMAALLISVYHATRFGTPLSKKSAWLEMGVEDLKTARKYMIRAEKLGLIQIEQSTQDKRKELLHPTARLKGLVERELELFAGEIFRSMYEISNTDSYAPALREPAAARLSKRPNKKKPFRAR